MAKLFYVTGMITGAALGLVTIVMAVQYLAVLDAFGAGTAVKAAILAVYGLILPALIFLGLARARKARLEARLSAAVRLSWAPSLIALMVFVLYMAALSLG